MFDKEMIEAQEIIEKIARGEVKLRRVFLADCEACDGKGYIPRTIHVYEPGCGFSHPDVAEDTCQACGGNGWFVCEAGGDQ